MNPNRFFQPITVKLVLLLISALTHAALAQGVFGIRPTPDRQQVGLGVGLEPELAASAGYSYRVSRQLNPLQFKLGAGVLVPAYLMHHGSVRLNGLLALDWQPDVQPTERSWAGRLALLPYYAHNRNDAGTLSGLGLEVRLLPLRRSNRWTGGLDLG